MPLIKSGSKAAISENISEMVHAGHPQKQAVAAAMRNARQYADGGDVPQRYAQASPYQIRPNQDGTHSVINVQTGQVHFTGPPSGAANAQATLNYRNRAQGGRTHMAQGGFTTPLGERSAQRQAFHEGFIHSNVPGRTDKLPISVSGGAYVLPADHVAALGQGNSNAGANIVNKMFKMGPYGSAPSALKGTGAKVPHLNLRPGKFADGGHGKTDIIAAGGEIVIPPHKIIERFGDLDKGHKALDKWVVDTRKQHVKTLKGLKPPRKD